SRISTVNLFILYAIHVTQLSTLFPYTTLFRSLYSGTFDPMTNGHLDVIKRSLKLVDHLIVAIGINATKTPLLSLEQRFALIEKEAGPTARKLGAKISTASFSGLVVDAADEYGATIIIRGLRGAGDF